MSILTEEQARAKLTAPSVKPGKYDLVLDPSHTWLTIHESIGHPLELDRVLGYEANYAGTSFATLDKLKDKFQYLPGFTDGAVSLARACLAAAIASSFMS